MKTNKPEMSIYTAKLLNSVFNNDTCLMIPAVAGSGKSTNLVLLSLHLHNKKIKGNNQRLVSFSNASARDLQDKINKTYQEDKVLKKDTPVVTTLHGLSSELLKKHFIKNFSILTQWNSIKLIRDILIDMDFFRHLSNPTTQEKTKIAMEIYNFQDKMKINLKVKTDDFLKANFAISKYYPNKVINDFNFKKVLLAYNNQKIKNNLMDYSDLLYKLVHLLSLHPKELASVKRDLKVLMVDEAQDLDALQWLLIMLLIANKRAVIVGDHKQGIYGFRDADSSKFSKEFISRFFKRVKTFELPINYRSTENIVRMGNLVRITRTPNALQAIPNKKSVKGSVTITKMQNQTKEGLKIVSLIEDSIKKGYKYSDITIISRTNMYLKSIESHLTKYQIPYKFATKSQGKTFNKRDSNLLYINLLNLVVNPSNIIALQELSGYIKGIGDVLKDKISKHLLNHSLNTLQSTKTSEQVALLTLGKLLQNLNDLNKRLNKGLKIKELLETLDTLTNQYIKNTVVTERERKTIHKTINQFMAYYVNETEVTDLSTMIETMLIEISDFENSENKNAVTLASVHSQKGLSQKISIVAGLTSHKKLDDKHKDEDCILYVQMSRAEDELHIITSQTYITSQLKNRKGIINQFFIRAMELAK